MQSLHQSMDTAKLDLFDSEISLNLCVNPNEVNPQSNQSVHCMSIPKIDLEDVCQDFNSATRSADDKPGGEFYSPSTPNLKLEMEVFGDLDAFYPSSNVEAIPQNAVDELNTPVFEIKAPFNFDRHDEQIGLLDIIAPSGYPIENIKVKHELSEYPTVYIENNILKEGIVHKNNKIKEVANNISNMLEDTTNQSNIQQENIGTLNNMSTLPFSPQNSENGDAYTSVFLEEEDGFIIVHSCNDIYPQHPIEYVENTEQSSATLSAHNFSESYQYDTPENSSSGLNSPIAAGSPKLVLKIDDKFKASDIISTPDVINAIDTIQLEKEFNILSYVNDKELRVASNILESKVIQNSGKDQIKSYEKSPRKRKSYDCDEDYVPPTKVKHVRKISVQNKRVSYDSEDSEEDFIAHYKQKQRKRNVSISSDEYSNADGTKYREMRDKNNEASRKSRLKRKLKEANLEKDAEDLEERNIKLKAQVSELEKTVGNFRNNLMLILLKK